jgi:hypothetical protein
MLNKFRTGRRDYVRARIDSTMFPTLVIPVYAIMKVVDSMPQKAQRDSMKRTSL